MSAAASGSGQRDLEGYQAIPRLMTDVGNGNGRENGFDSASTKVWRLYESKADKHDTELAETWKGQTDAMLIFTGLFSAVVAAFIIETYKMLLPDNGGATVALLTQLVAQSQPNGSTSSAVPFIGTQDFRPSGMAIRVNILMFISLFLGLTCALMSTLIQQWAREYLQNSRLSAPPQKRVRVRAYLFQGLTKFQMRKVVESVPAFLHASVFLFFFAVSEFLRIVDDTVGMAARCCFIILLSAYFILSILPFFVSSSPYQTALTTPLRPCAIILRFVVRLPVWVVRGARAPRPSFRNVLATAAQHNRSRELLTDTERRASSLDYLALQWLVTDVDEENMDKFVAGLPEIMHSPFIKDATVTMGALVADGMLERVGEHLTSSMSSREVSPALGISRALACVEAMDAIFSVLSTDNPRVIGTASALIKSSDAFRTRQDPVLALRAACIRALTFRKFIDSFSSQGPAHPPYSRISPHKLPLALRLQTWISLSSQRWRNGPDLEEAELRVVSSGYDAHLTIIHEGHMINFLVLIRDILSYIELPRLDLTSVWETLDTMVSAFGIAQLTASASVHTRFEEVHIDVRESLYLSNNWGTHEGSNNASLMPFSSGMDNPDRPSVDGLTTTVSTVRPPNTPSRVGTAIQRSLPPYIVERYTQLLEFMDKISKGSRLMTVLSANQPRPATRGSESPSKLDQIYVKDPFGVPDVLIALLSALPAFISSVGQDNARDTVKEIIATDGLFRSITVQLNTSINSEVPEATRGRMSLISLQILEAVFMLFNGSPDIHWYKLGVEGVLDAADNVASAPRVVGNLSSIHAYCTLGIISHIIVDNFCLRVVQGQQPIAQNLEEQLFILKVYDWLSLGNQGERKQRQILGRGHPETTREATSPQYLRSLVRNGPLQIFSRLAFHMIYLLKRKETTPEIVWATLRMLMNVPGLENADDAEALTYFDMVRGHAQMEVIEKEGSPSAGQLTILELLNFVANKLKHPELLIPMSVTPLENPGEFIAPNRSGYAPIYI